MSIVDVKKMPSGQQAGDSRAGETGADKWSVKLDDLSPYGQFTAKNAPEIPRLGTRHPNIRGVYCISRDAVPFGGGVYVVTVTWGNRQQGEAATASEDPTAVPFRIQRRWQSTREVRRFDLDGKVVGNSAGESADPPVTVEVLDRVFIITGIVDDTKANRDRLDEFNDVVNTDKVYGYEAGLGRMRTGFDRMVLGNRRYLDLEVEIVFRKVAKDVPAEHAWDERYIDEGFQTVEVVEGVRTLKPIIYADGSRPREPVRLNGKGGLLVPPDGKAEWLYFRMHERRKFGALNLPTED